MCNDNNTRDCSCIAEILTVIAILQKNASPEPGCLETCDRGFLGTSVSTKCLNTRPIMLYPAAGNGVPWTMPTTRDNTVCTELSCGCSNVFRVEKIDGCCATCRVLAENKHKDACCDAEFVATNSFFTIDLKCICCVRCLPDTFVELC